MTGRRVTGEHIWLDPESVQSFFARRAHRARSAHPLTSVLYQDTNPGLAEARDAAEKERLMPWLDLTSGTQVLDIACGIGRWATPIIESGASYVGVDFAEGLLEVAREAEPRGTYVVHDVSGLTGETIRELGPPQRILIAGALIYLNDPIVTQLAEAIRSGTGVGCRVVLREPTATQERLTLAQIQSAELGSTYSAIYRTRSEILEQFGGPLQRGGFRLDTDGDMFGEELNNRQETRQRFYVWSRKA